ncbi:hypothetical protein LSM04_009750 [Trypanosoma melophagium]|uniref:uncharacterized protein n=1 Tax=Trypanosoma melophagium TaxID=715481 RepID=UPI00351A46E8|nr:hypothetical protein LSM04_009750 [Trypanosoma melophagium]
MRTTTAREFWKMDPGTASGETARLLRLLPRGPAQRGNEREEIYRPSAGPAPGALPKVSRCCAGERAAGSGERNGGAAFLFAASDCSHFFFFWWGAKRTIWYFLSLVGVGKYGLFVFSWPQKLFWGFRFLCVAAGLHPPGTLQKAG